MSTHAVIESLDVAGGNAMQARNVVSILILTVILLAAARQVPADTSILLPPPNGSIVPPAWEGVWDVYEETRDCAGGPVLSTRSYSDTLCAGQSYYPFSIMYQQCSSNSGFTETAFHDTCGSIGIWPCPGNSTFNDAGRADWYLSGDVATTTVTITHHVQSGYPGCSTDTCRLTTGTRTRVSNGAAECLPVPTLPRSWGKLKLLYR